MPRIINQKVTADSFTQFNDDYFNQLCLYSATIIHVDRMLSQGLISTTEYCTISTKIADNCGLSRRSIYRVNNLIINGFRGNMSHYKEVTKCQEP